MKITVEIEGMGETKGQKPEHAIMNLIADAFAARGAAVAIGDSDYQPLKNPLDQTEAYNAVHGAEVTIYY